MLAHEYAHLYHGRILTDRENRRIRSLYHTAMEDDRTLDYYASNNESEFFAQGYAGFLSKKKVHPLNHKSMNTREYIRQKDPDFYTFLDSLLTKQEEYLDGNKEVFSDNWAQTFLTLAERSRSDDKFGEATAYLDTAMTHSADYIPALLEYAEVNAEQGNFEAAENKITEARKLNLDYAPTYVSEANIIHQKALHDQLSFDEAMDEQIALFEKAERLEGDLSERARLNRLYRQRSHDYGYLAEAVEVAEQYVQDAPTVSTYLRDRKEEAEAFANFTRSSLGYSADVVDYFDTMVSQNPQNFGYRLMYADVLLRADQPDQALATLQEGQRILASADNERTDYSLRIAKIHVGDEQESKAEEILKDIEVEELGFNEQILLTEIYAEMDRSDDGKEVLDQVEEPVLPAEKAEFQYVQGVLNYMDGEDDGAMDYYQQALEYNPYHLEARTELIRLMKKQENEEVATSLEKEADNLAIPLGPDFEV